MGVPQRNLARSRHGVSSMQMCIFDYALCSCISALCLCYLKKEVPRPVAVSLWELVRVRNSESGENGFTDIYTLIYVLYLVEAAAQYKELQFGAPMMTWRGGMEDGGRLKREGYKYT